MKRLFSLLLALALLLALCACDKAAPAPAFTVPTPAAVAPTPAATPSPAAPTATPTTSGGAVDTVAHYEKFREIIVGSWRFCELYLTDLECYLQIYPDFSCTMQISNYSTGEIICEYSGNVVEEWAARDSGADIPDFLSFDLYDGAGDYVYGGIFSVEYLLVDDYYNLMLYDRSYGETPFDLLETAIISFFTPTDDKLTDTPRRNGSFPVAFWSYDQESGALRVQHVYKDALGGYRSETHQVLTYSLTSAAFDELDHMYLELDMRMEITTDQSGRVIGVTRIFEDDGSEGETPFYDYLDTRSWDIWGSNWPASPPAPRSAIIDLDGDGALEMLFEAYDRSSAMPMGISQFCNLDPWGEVEVLLSCDLSGGTMGGETLSFYYDNETDGFLVGLAGHAAGFGGHAEWYQMYSYANNRLTLLTEFDLYSPDHETEEYTIDEKTATEAQYLAVVDRFSSVVMYH